MTRRSLFFALLCSQRQLHFTSTFSFQANRLRQTHPEAAEQIYDLQRQLNEEWNRLTGKSNSRKEKLLDSYDYQRFLADFRSASLPLPQSPTRAVSRRHSNSP